MKIYQATSADQKEWDDFVSRPPGSSPYHLMGWTLAIENAYKFKFFNLVAKERGQIVGILPLTLFKIPFKQPSLVALPYCDLGALLTTTEQAKTELLNAALDIGRKHNVSILELRGDVDKNSLEKCSRPVDTSNTKVRMMLELPGSSEALWKGFKSKLRSQVRKAQKNGLQFELTRHKVDEFYAIFSENMRDLGSPVHSKKWIEEVVKQFGDKALLGLVYHEDRAVGAGLILRAGKKISIPWASTLREWNHLSPNMLLYWGFLQYGADNGCEVFDFGRSTPNEGTYRFKAQWGAKPKDLPWHSIHLRGQPQSGRSGPSKKRQRLEAIWQKLPITVANYIGPRVRKFISL